MTRTPAPASAAALILSHDPEAEHIFTSLFSLRLHILLLRFLALRRMCIRMPIPPFALFILPIILSPSLSLIRFRCASFFFLTRKKGGQPLNHVLLRQVSRLGLDFFWWQLQCWHAHPPTTKRSEDLCTGLAVELCCAAAAVVGWGCSTFLTLCPAQRHINK